jgi:hypothetical protein
LFQAIAAGVAAVFGLKIKPQPTVNPQTQPQPKLMHRVLVDGKAVIDSAYKDKVLVVISAALDKYQEKSGSRNNKTGRDHPPRLFFMFSPVLSRFSQFIKRLAGVPFTASRNLRQFSSPG